MIIAPELDAIEFAFDYAKYGECPTDPVMEIVVPSVHDASLAPDGQHVLVSPCHVRALQTQRRLDR